MNKFIEQLKEFGKTLVFTFKLFFIISKEETSLSHLPQVMMYEDYRLYRLISRLKLILWIALLSATLLYINKMPRVDIATTISYVFLVYFIYVQYIKIKSDIALIIHKPDIKQEEINHVKTK